MTKLSTKQKEVVRCMRDGAKPLNWYGRLKPSCRISGHRSVPVSITTAMKLMDLGIIATEEKYDNRTYRLTELGKTIKLD